MRGLTRKDLKSRAPAVIAAVLVHAAVLLPIALSVPRTPPAPAAPELLVLPLDLTPATPGRVGTTAGRPARLRLAAAPASSPTPAPPATEGPVDTARPVVPTADNRPAVDDAWRVRAGLNPPARLPCPAAPGDRLGQRLCLVGPAPDRDREPEQYAEVAPSRQDASDRSREEGFDRQVQANEAWRAYTRGEGAYPGLRSLFRDR